MTVEKAQGGEAPAKGPFADAAPNLGGKEFRDRCLVHLVERDVFRLEEAEENLDVVDIGVRGFGGIATRKEQFLNERLKQGEERFVNHSSLAPRKRASPQATRR